MPWKGMSSTKWQLASVFSRGISPIKRLLNLGTETDEPYGEARMTKSRMVKIPIGTETDEPYGEARMTRSRMLKIPIGRNDGTGTDEPFRERRPPKRSELFRERLPPKRVPNPLDLKPFSIRIPKIPKLSSSDRPLRSSIRSAEELQEAGIEFKRKEGKPGGSFLDIQFHENGVIQIPYFYFSDNLNSIFQNLIAYEQCYPKAPTFFTGYASFMDDIINTAKDIQILRHAEILEHGLGSDEELAGLFNQMNKGVFVDPEQTHLYKECKAINEFCGTRWHTYRANLMRNYFYSPWAILSLAAALLLLLLTITQTVFSIYPNV